VNKNEDRFTINKKDFRTAYSMVEHINKMEQKLKDDHERLVKNAIFSETPMKSPSPFIELWEHPFKTANGKPKKVKDPHAKDPYVQECIGEFPVHWEEYDYRNFSGDPAKNPPSPDKASVHSRQKSVVYSEFKSRLLENMNPAQAIFQYDLRMDDLVLNHWIDTATTHFYPTAPVGVLDSFERQLKREFDEAFQWIFNGSGYKTVYPQFRELMFKEYPALDHNGGGAPVDPNVRKMVLDGSRNRFANELSDAEFKLYRDRLEREIDEKEWSDWEKLHRSAPLLTAFSQEEVEDAKREMMSLLYKVDAGALMGGNNSEAQAVNRAFMEKLESSESNRKMAEAGSAFIKSKLHETSVFTAKDTEKTKREGTYVITDIVPSGNIHVDVAMPVEDRSTRVVFTSGGIAAIPHGHVNPIPDKMTIGIGVGVYNPQGLKDLEIYSDKEEIEVEPEGLYEHEVCETCGSTTGCMCPRKPVKKTVVRDNKGSKNVIVDQMYKSLTRARGMAFAIGDDELFDMLEPPVKHVMKRMEKKVK